MLQRDENPKKWESFRTIWGSNNPTQKCGSVFTAQCGFEIVLQLSGCVLCQRVSLVNQSLRYRSLVLQLRGCVLSERVKGVVYNFNAVHFCQIQRISPHSPLAPHSVCVLKKQSGDHIQPWLCKWETNSGRTTNPGCQIRFSRSPQNETSDQKISHWSIWRYLESRPIYESI